MKKQNKGFTIVELVIVIAVIAVLASVLVPTFSGVIAKAQVSADTQTVCSLNKYLAVDLAGTELKKHDTMYDAVQASIKTGLAPDKIISKSGYSIAWESTSGRFVLIDVASKTVVYPQEEKSQLENVLETYNVEGKEADYFIVTEYDKRIEQDLDFKFSIYATGDWSNHSEIKIHSSFDAGDAEGLKKITYENLGSEKEVIIRTNTYATDLCVNAPLDTVKHYGKVGKVSVLEVADHSYIEYGNGALIEVNDGHIVVSKGANIKGIHITKKTESSFEDVKITIEDAAELPVFTRDAIVIPNEGVKVCTIEFDSNSQDIYLTKQGVIEQVVFTEEQQPVSSGNYADIRNGLNTYTEVASMLANQLPDGSREENVIVTNSIMEFNYETREFVKGENKVVVAQNTAADALALAGSKMETTVDSYGVIYNYNKTVLINGKGLNRACVYKIPEGCEEILYAAFGQGDSGNNTLNPQMPLEEVSNVTENLLGVVLPSTMKYIGNKAFRSCPNLTGSIKLNEGLISIGDNAFSSTGISGDIIIPDSVTTIGPAPWNNDHVGGLYIGANSQLSSLGKKGFQAYWNGTLDIKSASAWNVIANANNPLSAGTFDNESLVIPEGVTKLPVLANRINPYTVSLPSTLLTIPDQCFRYCTNLEGIVIPASVTSIGQHAFKDTGYMEYITLNGGGKIAVNAFYGASSCLPSVEITITKDSKITEINTNAFAYLNKVTGKIEMPTTLKNLTATSGNAVFSHTTFPTEYDFSNCADSVVFSGALYSQPSYLANIGETECELTIKVSSEAFMNKIMSAQGQVAANLVTVEEGVKYQYVETSTVSSVKYTRTVNYVIVAK